ncbi:hypothetical protein CTA2_5532 [Colletotrichum tanaceti]|uniref:Uncharacterized protein n=1 Tax=Colletotrichum tanaceti TaxID=1306861 RepID=A0A4U6XT81_9PEZI|nr:hypothetical protein CTA2_5532 [Colletotrichum tanaceti]TKW59147.1 hypothetical protein CTA1_912 [Colletotrichum tanaceti]
MPTVTTLSQYTISNIGPLTTVFTVPPACATKSKELVLGLKFPDGDQKPEPQWFQSCEFGSLGECFPSGKAMDDAWASVEAEGGITDFGQMAYFSPASQCPEGQVTVGVAAKNDAGQISSSGVFVPPVTEYPGVYLPFNPPLNVFMEALDNGETAVVCCPEGYEPRLNGGGCYSEVPLSSYGEMTACDGEGRGREAFTWVNATFSYNNTIHTGEVISWTATSLPKVTYSTTTLESQWSDVSTVAWAVGVGATMVHRPADAATGDGSGAAGPTETAPSAAQGWRMTTSGGGVGVLATAWALAALVGVTLVVPW